MLALAATDVAGQPNRGKPAGTRRSAPPAGTWDGVTAGTFLPDAFSTLEGQRPVFTPGGRTLNPGSPNTVVTGSPGGGATGAFKWSSLASEDTLVDEIKDLKAAIATACGKPTDFKGGGFEEARVAFSALAVAFGVIAAYDGDVRWKKDAATARDLFARAGFNCKVGTEQSFNESKARLEDLESLLDGNSPKGKPDRDDDFRWSQVAGRPALMNRLEQAQDAMRPAIASKADFGGRMGDLLHAVEVVAVIGEVIRQPDFEYHDDDTYRGYAAAMRDAAAEARAACEKKDYEAARAAVGKIEKACDACHGDYRS
ncbi:MAG: cytochrome c [Planctomycetaceae bacterium]